jgi:hypothetical protein
MSHRTPAYWPTRLRLAVGIIATALVVLLALVAVNNARACFTCDYQSTLVTSVVAVGLALVGLAWMLRIFRGPRDEPPVWRHRDR